MNVSAKYRLYPTKEQIEFFNKTFGCVRFVHNYFLNLREKIYQEEGKYLYYNKATPMLKPLKEKFPWLEEVEYKALEASLKDLFNGIDLYFEKHANFPVFKTKKETNSYRTRSKEVRIIDDKYIKIPKLGKVKVKIHRKIEGKIKFITISRKPSGKYYVSVTYECDEIPQLPKTEKRVGIDVGVHDFAVLSNGQKIKNLRIFDSNLKKLAKLNRSYAKKKRGSKNKEKARIKLTRFYEKIANQKKDYLHKISKYMVTEFDEIVIEDLKIKKLYVEGIRNINRSLANLNIYEFRRMLEYKCKRYGKELIIAPENYPSSQLCSNCGVQHSITKNLKIRNWTCPTCQTNHNRDLNAAINLYNYCI